MVITTDFSGEEWTPLVVKVQREADQRKAMLEAIEASKMKVLAVDLARQSDASCILGLDCTLECIKVRNCEIFHRTTYNALIDRLLEIKTAVPDIEMVYDMTGVGLAVTDLFLARGLYPSLGVVITSGNKANSGKDLTGIPRFSCPKADLVAHITKLLNTGAIEMGGSGPGFEVLKKEMQQFTANVKKTGYISYEAPQGQHDDSVLSLAIGIAGYTWLVKRMQRQRKAVQVYDGLTGRKVE
jgi:hypothetical protein